MLTGWREYLFTNLLICSWGYFFRRLAKEEVWWTFVLVFGLQSSDPWLPNTHQAQQGNHYHSYRKINWQFFLILQTFQEKLYLHDPILFLLRSVNNHCKNILKKIILNFETKSTKTSSKMFFFTFFDFWLTNTAPEFCYKLNCWQTYTDAKNEEHFTLFLQTDSASRSKRFVNSGPVRTYVMTTDPQTFKQTHYIEPTTNWRNMKFDNGLFRIELSFNTGKIDERLPRWNPRKFIIRKIKRLTVFY